MNNDLEFTKEPFAIFNDFLNLTVGKTTLKTRVATFTDLVWHVSHSARLVISEASLLQEHHLQQGQKESFYRDSLLSLFCILS